MKDRRKWTSEEDALLIQAMKQFRYLQDVRWTEVAATIPDRTPKACRKRWVNGLNDRLKKGTWTPEEDNRLRQGVALLNYDWARIAEHVGQRSGDQCSKRWREVLDPAINKSPWTPEEDELLSDLYHKYGSSWQVISTKFNNRRALQCRNRCCKLLSLHGTPRYVVTPSLDSVCNNSVLNSGELSHVTSPTSPLSLSLPAVPTPVPHPQNQDDTWPKSNPLNIPQEPQTLNIGKVSRNTVSSIIGTLPPKDEFLSSWLDDPVHSPVGYPVAEWKLESVPNMHNDLAHPMDMNVNITPPLEPPSDLFAQPLYGSPGALSPSEAMSIPSTPSVSLPHSRCNSTLVLSPRQQSFGSTGILDVNVNYSMGPSHHAQSFPPLIQDVSGSNIDGQDIESLLFPMKDNSIAVGEEDDLATQVANQNALQWITGMVPRQYAA